MLQVVLMKPTPTQRDDFLAYRPVPGLTFALNDYVNVIVGELAGESGTVTSLEEIGQDPVYLVKLDSDKYALLPASFLQPEGDN